MLTTEPPLRLWLIIDEAVVRRQVGGPKVMQDQVQHLIEIATQLPNVTLQMVPFSAGGHAGMEGPFSILMLPAASLTNVVYVESRAGHLFLNQQEDLQVFREVFNYLRATASNEEESIAALERIAQEFVN